LCLIRKKCISGLRGGSFNRNMGSASDPVTSSLPGKIGGVGLDPFQAENITEPQHPTSTESAPTGGMLLIKRTSIFLLFYVEKMV